jgi:hypothetical protein
MILGFSYIKFPNWMRGHLAPDLVVGGSDSPYLLRWYVIPRNPLCNVYLHKFLRDDDDRALHDHPWPSVSFLLMGELWEVYKCGEVSNHFRKLPWLKPVYRPAEFAHRLMLSITHEPAWTLFITGRKVREWGFWCPQGFKHWRDFVAPDDSGKIGKGCSD